MGSNHRPFATGSKPGPDALDHYLEEKGFYRKHVARDASSLFRVVSEQVFDIQTYHEKIRQDCATYMEAHQEEYANDVDKNFFNYISQMRRPRNHGTLLELRVLARMFRRNVILFEPTQSLQTNSYIYVKNDDYDCNEPLRVFYSQKDKHFDVIYTMDYAQRLASCQALVYDILYSDVFKIPDVQYAVERMLHDPEEQVTLPLPDDPSKYSTHSGEIIPFDSYATKCVLKDPKTCHFHNQVDFESVVNERNDAIMIINQKNEPGRMKMFKPIDGFLYDDEKSCVRQLLAERITPFPYKVAKALDPSIYRNTEFELWSENRKEQRMKWLDSADFSSKPFSDDKWAAYDCNHCYRGGSSGKRYNEKLERPVVDELTYMSLDDDLKKKYIILRPSAEPINIQNLTSMDHFLPSRDSLELTVMPINTNYGRGGFRKRGGGRPNSYHNQGAGNFHSSTQHHYNTNQYHGTSGHQASQPQMTHVSEIEHEATYYQEQQEPQAYVQQQQPIPGNLQETLTCEQQVSAPMYQPIVPQWNNQLVPFITQQPIQYATPLNYHQVMPFGNFTIPPPPPLVQSASPNSEFCSGEAPGGDFMNLLQEAELSSTTVNWKPEESTDQNGADLPTNNISTLQFYYNLGVRYFLATGVQRRLEGVVQQLESVELNDVIASTRSPVGNSGEKKEHKAVKQKLDPPPVPANTPVSTKPVSGIYGPPGYRYAHNNAHNNFRRPFGVNRDSGSYRGSWNSHPRKDIKFNSNVRNANKADMKTSESGSQTTTGVQTHSHQGSESAALGSNTGPPQEKLTLNNNNTATNQYSPVSTNSQETQQVQVSHPVDQSQQYYQNYPHTFIPQQQQGMVYQLAEDGSGYMVQHVQQPLQYSQTYPYPIQPGPFYYPVHNYPPMMDGSTLSSNDSGVVDTNMYQGYQQPQVQYYSASYQVPQPVPMYFAPSPLPQTSQIAPIFPVAQQHQVQVPIQASLSHQASVVSVVSRQASENSSPKASDHNSAENAASS